MTQRKNWYPRGIFHYIEVLAFAQKLAIDEVAFNLLREALSEHGFVCDHSNVKYSKNDKQLQSKPYCNSCYSRLEKIQEKKVFRGKIITENEFRPIETFIDADRKERAQKAKAESEVKINAEVESRLKAIIDSAAKKDENKQVSTV